MDECRPIRMSFVSEVVGLWMSVGLFGTSIVSEIVGLWMSVGLFGMSFVSELVGL